MKSSIFQGDSSHHKICIADINIRSYDKDIKRFSPETVGAQGGVLGDGVIELHSLERGGDEPKLKGCINQTNLLEMNDNPK